MLDSMPMPTAPSLSRSWPITGIMLVDGQANTLEMTVIIRTAISRRSRRTSASPSTIRANTLCEPVGIVVLRWRTRNAATRATR